MQKMIYKLMVATGLIFAFEIVVLALLYIYLQLDGTFLVEGIIVICALFVTFDIFFCFTSLKKIAQARKKNDLTATEIIGDDIQEVYNFAQIGLIIVDNENFVVWANERFDFISAQIIDKDIYSWKPELETLKTGAENTKVKIDNRIYQVKLIKEANLFIFKDVTSYDAVVDFSYLNSPVIGLISIDNYQDAMNLFDEVYSNDIIASVQKNIVNYAKKYDILIKKYRSDSYLMVTTREKYDLMFKDKFYILEEVREEIKSTEYAPTLSIGIAFGVTDINKLYDLATSALDVALSRGGDQVVVSQYGEALQYYGGKSEAKSKRNRVRARVLSQSLQAQIVDSSSVFFMGHRDSDLDAIGSSLGLYEFVQQCKKEVHIIYDDKLYEQKAKNAFKEMFTRDEIKEMTVSPKTALETIDNNSLVMSTDVSRPSFTLAPKLVEMANKIAIIDHHRRGEEFPEHPVLSYIEPAASSASELVAELVRYNDKPKKLSSKTACIMLAGILLDTNYYRSKTGPRTYDASIILKEFGADNAVSDDFLKEEYEEYALKVRIMSNSFTPYYGIVVCKADEEDPIDRTMLAMCAQETLQIKGINACFVVGKTEAKKVGVSARSDGTINVQLLMEKMGGGGHFNAAAAQIENRTVDEVISTLKVTLDLYLNEARVQEETK